MEVNVMNTKEAIEYLDELQDENFELQESERLASARKIGMNDEMYHEPLIDPSTGFSDEEMMDMVDERSAIEAIIPIEKYIE